MSLLGFDAIGRLALGQNPGGTGVLPAVFGGSFGIWPPAIRPKNFAQDWIAFSDNFSINSPKFTQPFSPFTPPPHPQNFARDWIAFAGHPKAGQFPSLNMFSRWDPPFRPRNFAKDWIAFSGNYFVETTTLSFFTNFDPAPKPHNFAKDWIEYNEFGFTFVPVTLIGIDFMPFSPGQTAKLWTRYGQQPQWWTYEFKPPPSKFPDKHDYGWPIRQYHRPHPVVYEQEYYDAVNRRWVNAPPPEEEPLSPPRVPNLLIPINRLIQPREIPSLHTAPPYRPVPTLHVNPPAFRMATPEENAMDYAAIIKALLED